MVSLYHSIGRSKFFSRARAYVRAHTRSIAALFCVVISALQLFAADPAFIRGNDGLVHGIAIDQRSERATHSKLKILSDCQKIKKQPGAMALKGSQTAQLSVHVSSMRGVIALAGLRQGTEPKIFDTELSGPYKNFPTSMHAEKDAQDTSRYPLAIVLAAALPEQGDFVLQKGDNLTINADGQVDRFNLMNLTIPAGGVLTVYPGTDDTLYFDPGLKHPVHEGRCKTKAK